MEQIKRFRPILGQLAVSTEKRALKDATFLCFHGQKNKRQRHCSVSQRYTDRVLKIIQIKLILLCVWADQAVLGSAKTALKFKYDI